jgi:hypothetical protein
MSVRDYMFKYVYYNIRINCDSLSLSLSLSHLSIVVHVIISRSSRGDPLAWYY